MTNCVSETLRDEGAVYLLRRVQHRIVSGPGRIDGGFTYEEKVSASGKLTRLVWKVKEEES